MSYLHLSFIHLLNENCKMIAFCEKTKQYVSYFKHFNILLKKTPKLKNNISLIDDFICPEI